MVLCSLYTIGGPKPLFWGYISFKQTPQQFSKEYKSYVAKINVKTSVYGAFGFDAAWMAAIALNSSTEGKSATRRDLLDIHEGAATEEIKENLLRTRFVGVTVGILVVIDLSDATSVVVSKIYSM